MYLGVRCSFLVECSLAVLVNVYCSSSRSSSMSLFSRWRLLERCMLKSSAFLLFLGSVVLFVALQVVDKALMVLATRLECFGVIESLL